MKKLEEYVRTIPDFPEKGIMFRDVTSVIQDADGLSLAQAASRIDGPGVSGCIGGLARIWPLRLRRASGK